MRHFLPSQFTLRSSLPVAPLALSAIHTPSARFLVALPSIAERSSAPFGAAEIRAVALATVTAQADVAALPASITKKSPAIRPPRSLHRLFGLETRGANAS